MEDERIVDLFFKRDEQALRIIEKKYGKLCFSVANNILNDREDARECVNDTYLAAWESIPPARPGRLSAYLAKIARNKALTLYERSRRKKRGEGFSALLSELSEEVASAERADGLLNEHFVSGVINDYLHSIPKNKAAIFVERYFMCCSLEEISDITGYSYNKVSVMLHRMRAELKEKLRKEGVEV